ncbi:MAG: AarF/UbiB family protein, partial [Pseudomonadota bacterium]|nr:AarF/UbiB family protein [Pseudomonadota bacterium]
MRGPHNIVRLIRTGATFERTGAMQVVLDAFEAPKPLRILARTLGWPFKWLGYKGDPSMPPATRALTALGPAYIKFGQVLSTRPDVVGQDMAQQLRVLQDQLPPLSRDGAIAQVERELGQPVSQIYSEFSEPIAAASIAQVHRARLVDSGREVAVKVLRPGIERAFNKDVDAFYFAARIADLFAPGARRLKPMDVIEHFDGVVQGELDLRLESAAASEFAANTKGDEGFQLPEILWNYSARRVMTLGWADGLPIGDNAAARRDTEVASTFRTTVIQHASFGNGRGNGDTGPVRFRPREA